MSQLRRGWRPDGTRDIVDEGPSIGRLGTRAIRGTAGEGTRGTMARRTPAQAEAHAREERERRRARP